ncbi:N-acetylmuramoyl-L-alanine amidase [Mesorhizobium sp. NBSH29]|uniref:N-acetylmuramoyl-L-alanine amidase n=1 Tax=Mesorhizobium sp. NBSH29 TaxID=2654249 RepID=UPI0018967D74|nr:N-acetylmuramoyl-L-alanine amidase [Mesorhizobium sp. NBSH29]QPC88215.1 N-acetylmuramoyl-L-alanine amidase [Mesorhizobium sp. NBSH29]
MTFEPDHNGVSIHPSPNIGARRAGAVIDILVMHYTGMETGDAALELLADPGSQVSAHYVVHVDGNIVQMVPESARAWHAGKGSWRGNTDVNTTSIGIEVVNPGHYLLDYPDFPAGQIDAVMSLCRGILGRHRISPRNVIAHSDLAPGRKVDPGEKFPWDVLAKAGIGQWVDPAVLDGGPAEADGTAKGVSAKQVQEMLAEYGYGIGLTGVFDSQMKTVVREFQRHFRRDRVDGVADWSTVDTLTRLLASAPERVS